MTFRLLLLTLLLLVEGSLALADALNNVRIWPTRDYTRLVFDLSAPVKHKLFTLSKPERVVIDLTDTRLRTDLNQLELDNSPIKTVRSARREHKNLRVVLDMSSPMKPKSFTLKPEGQFGHRLVVDLYQQHQSLPTKTIKQVDTVSPKRDVLIVIDPGHGGRDPGALGPKGVREKDIVLAVSKELVKLLNKEKGFTAQLTRKGDYFIQLRQRNKVAREHNADLLVSVHADAFKRKEASGASVFALSKRGATSETARWLAASENTADLIGGVGGVSLDDKDDVLAGVLLDLSMTASMKASINVGTYVLEAMGEVTKLHKPQVEQAGFVVLKSPDIPSILVETGFISNPAEARKLKTRKHQRKLAKAIHKGLKRYFIEEPPPQTLLAWQKQQRLLAQENTHVIRKGDTLSEIAKVNNVSLSLLKNHNQLRNDVVRIGQVLKIPKG